MEEERVFLVRPDPLQNRESARHVSPLAAGSAAVGVPPAPGIFRL